MESVIRQSLNACPYLRKTGPAALKALAASTSSFAPVAAAAASTGVPVDGGVKNKGRTIGSRKNVPLSSLQRMAGRCPVMGRAMAVRSAKMRAGKSLVFTRALHSGSGGISANAVGKAAAGMHTSRPKLARAMDVNVLKAKVENGKHIWLLLF